MNFHLTLSKIIEYDKMKAKKALIYFSAFFV